MNPTEPGRNDPPEPRDDTRGLYVPPSDASRGDLPRAGAPHGTTRRSADGPHTGDAGDAGDDAARRLADVHERIRAACAACGRDPATVRLLAVSKTFDASHVARFAALGQTAFGENYVQEGVDKIATLAGGMAASSGAVQRLCWHFIGPIQSNKTRPVAGHFDWVHSIDRERIARRLSEQRPAGLPPLYACIQVNVSGEASKSGCTPDEAPALALAVAGLPGLELRGLMAIPEPTQDRAALRERFESVRVLRDAIRDRLPPSAQARFDVLSMGMSDDLEPAIEAGSTLVRVGSALFGARPRAA